MNSQQTSLYLASSSPRRAELLTQIDVCFEVLQCSIDETTETSETPIQYVTRMAMQKAREGFRVMTQLSKSPLPVLAADTIVVVNEKILGKPETEEQAADMLRQLSGTTHNVMTAVTVMSDQGVETVMSDTQVMFREISEAEATAYWQTNEPCDKAGGYGIQGLGAIFVARIEGSYSGVVGLPLTETAGLLESVGIRCL